MIIGSLTVELFSFDTSKASGLLQETHLLGYELEEHDGSQLIDQSYVAIQ